MYTVMSTIGFDIIFGILANNSDSTSQTQLEFT